MTTPGEEKLQREVDRLTAALKETEAAQADTYRKNVRLMDVNVKLATTNDALKKRVEQLRALLGRVQGYTHTNKKLLEEIRTTIAEPLPGDSGGTTV